MKTKQIASLGILIALAVVLNEVLSISIPPVNKPIVQFSLGIIPLFLIGYYFGPLTGISAGIIIDLLGILLFGLGKGFTPHLGFTLNSAISGFVPGMIMKYKGKINKRLFTIINLVLIILILAGLSYVVLNVDLIGTVELSPTVKYIVIAICFVVFMALFFYIIFHKKTSYFNEICCAYIIISVSVTLLLTPLWVYQLNKISYFAQWPLRLIYIPIQVVVWSLVTEILIKSLKPLGLEVEFEKKSEIK